MQHAERIPESPPPVRRSRSRPLALGIAFGLLIGITISVAGLIYFFRSSVPILTPDALAAAEKRWAELGPSSYDVDLELQGTQAGTIQVEVRQGEVTRMIRNGRQPSQRRTWYYWSIPGQFETIAVDLDHAANPEQGFGVPAGSAAVLRAEFDPQYGYPRFYQRILLGTPIHVEWKVTRFEKVGE